MAKVFHGLHRGEPLVERFFYRLKGILDFEPFKGTLNLRLEKPVDLSEYETKILEHIDTNGKHVIEGRFIPAKLVLEKENEIVEEDCWIFRHEKGPYKNDVLEIISSKCLEKEHNLKDGDEVEVIVGE